MGAVCYKRSGYPDLGVHTSPFEPLSYLLSPQGRRRFVRQLQGHSRRLWRLGSIVARVGRGTGSSSAACSGCVGRLRGREDPSLRLSIPTGLWFAPSSPMLVEKLSKKSPSSVSSVEIAGIPQRNKPSVPTSWASNAFVTELARLFRQFQKVNSANFARTEFSEVRRRSSDINWYI
jgi:hypothetical protein